ncbi:hypothetical protein ACFQPA_17725 [Halomarina halobia]|uniref:Uncharacterized protein n=1 Tax=Halomarina halobia TaxID=3033386 RepID=A0ABD6ADZ6_9EURY|nr:hypothetical protein [Halomarina sp. PSR21]
MGITARLGRHARGVRLNVTPLGPLEWLGAFLAVVTGLIHVYLFLRTGFLPFLLAGAGFFGGVGLLFTAFPRRLLYAMGVPYLGVQIVLWVLTGMGSFALGVFDKTVQTLLVGLLVALLLIELEIDLIEEVSTVWDDRDEE